MNAIQVELDKLKTSKPIKIEFGMFISSYYKNRVYELFSIIYHIKSIFFKKKKK